jgi:hypothetical protein
VLALRYFIYFVTQLKNLWIKTPRVVRWRRRATLTWASWTFQLKICCSTIVSRGKRERERASLSYIHCSFMCCMHSAHDSLGIFNASCAEGTFYDVIWEANKKAAPLQFQQSISLSLSLQVRWYARATLGLSLHRRDLCLLASTERRKCAWQGALLLLTLWHTATGARTPAAAHWALHAKIYSKHSTVI